MQLEWDVPFSLIPSVDAAGTEPGLDALPFNTQASEGTTPLGFFLLDSAKCSAGAGRRVTRTNLAQADGEITHRKFKTGYVVELNAQLWETVENPACAGTLREMGDLLGEYLEAMANNGGQLVWFPSAWPEGSAAPNPRMLDQARSLGPSGAGDGGFVSVNVTKEEDGKLVDVTFALLSPLPYLTDFMNYPTSPDEVATLAAVGGDGAATVSNEGNVAYQPVIRVYGPCSGFTLQNLSVVDEIGNPLQIVYDDTLNGAFPIPAGAYVEIDTFKSTVRVHLAGGGTDNAKSCIDVVNTDFFELAPGDNDLFVLGGASITTEVVYRNAWA